MRPSHPRPPVHLRLLAPASACLALAAPARAQDLGMDQVASYLLIVAASAGSEGRVACREMDMAIQLKKRGVSVDAKANVAWAFTAPQARDYAQEGKLVICTRRSLFAEGGAIAFERVGGRLTVFVSRGNLERSGVKLPESFLRGAVQQ
jgi:hypothetical protein